MKKDLFIKLVWEYYKKHGRDLPWRNTRDPYHILVSEIMLQQTQVDRVMPKYTAFLKKFPTMKSLATATPKEVLILWQGLGYNSRALRLQKAVQTIMKKYDGIFPQRYEDVLALPGVGPATAGDICAFAWNIPYPVIETNIRTVYIHHFFTESTKVSDAELLPIITETLDTKNPREWYWALFDYGAHLKKQVKNNKQSKHYSTQSRFEGSVRQKRGAIVRALISKPQSLISLSKYLGYDSLTLLPIIQKMKKEGVVRETKGTLYI